MPETPIVGTGMEVKAARDSRTLIVTDVNGVVENVSADEIVIRKHLKPPPGKSPEDLPPEYVYYKMKKFVRTNQDTCINQVPIV